MVSIKELKIGIAITGMRAIYSLIKLFPTRRKVAFISRQSDSSSIDINMLVEAMHDEHPDWQTVVLCKRLKNKFAYVFHIVKQMYHIATSRTVVLDSYCIPISVLNHKDSLCVIQMWHAIGSMKEFGYAMIGKPEGSDPLTARLMKMHANYDYILISSMNYLDDYLQGFHCTKEQVLEIPLPRADKLSDENYMAERRTDILAEHPEYAQKKNIIYCPTFRKESNEFDRAKILELVNAVDYDKCNFIYKPHSLSEIELDDPRIINFRGNNIDALAIADYVISDYSSVIYEAGLAKRPVYLYAYDWGEYSGTRTFNIDLASDIPALFTADPAEIMRAIGSQGFDEDAFAKFIEKNVTMPETSCTEEIVKLICMEGK